LTIGLTYQCKKEALPPLLFLPEPAGNGRLVKPGFEAIEASEVLRLLVLLALVLLGNRF
jgi:hypothetical protein